MIYQKRNNKSKLKQNILIFFIFIIAIFSISKIEIFQNITRSFVFPFVKVGAGMSGPFSGGGNIFNSKEDLLFKIKQLEDELEKTKISFLKTQVLEFENRELRKLNEDSLSEDPLLAKVVTRPPFSPYDTLNVDKGFSDGLSENNKVMFGDLYVGYLAELSESSAIVRLISSPHIETPVRIRGEFDAVAIGRGGGRITIELPKDSEVENGDVVVLQDSGNHIVGVISNIVFDEIDSFKTLYVSLPVSLSSISFVEIVK